MREELASKLQKKPVQKIVDIFKSKKKKRNQLKKEKDLESDSFTDDLDD